MENVSDKKVTDTKEKNISVYYVLRYKEHKGKGKVVPVLN
jgi:hypothetical protein